MMYLQEKISEVQRKLRNGEDINIHDDIATGTQLIDALHKGRIQPFNSLFMQSLDGTQIYQDKNSDSWIMIYILFIVCPGLRYKKGLVLPGGIIAGPNNLVNMESFLFPGLYHISALQKEGLQIWDALNQTYFQAMLIYWLTSADGPGSVHVSGLVGHKGVCACQLFCGLKGRRLEGKPTHYLAFLKPNNYSIPGCDHDNLTPSAIKNGSSLDYPKKCAYLLKSTGSNYKTCRRETGISCPSILLGLQPQGIISVPATFGGDAMHCLILNLGEILTKLWHGTLECSPSDDFTLWTWAVLHGVTWVTHGKAVAACKQYIPGSFDYPLQNIAEKVNS